MEEIADFSLGKMLDQKKNKGSLLPYLANVNVLWGHFDLSNLRRMRFEPHEADRYGLRPGDIVMCEGGEPGRCAIWKAEIPGVMIQKALHRIRPHAGLHYQFLFYSLFQQGRSGGFDRLFTGSTIKHLPRENLAKVELNIPPLPIQERIASILGAYDDLIDVNRRRIELMEETARRLFDEWFVRFRFPGHEDCELVESPRGVVPTGWRVCKVKELVERQPNGRVYREADCQGSGSVIVIDQSSEEMLGYHSNEPDHNATPAKPIAIFGDHTCKMQLLVSPFSVGPNTVPFKAKDAVSIYYLFSLIRGLTQTKEYKRHWNELMGNEVLVAPAGLTALYADAVRPLFQLEEILQRQNRILCRQRDLLLPRLISGHLSISVVKHEREAVA